MAIIIEHVKSCKELGFISPMSLVSCEHLQHQGYRDRLINKYDAKLGKGTKFCKSCLQLGKKGSAEKRRKISESNRNRKLSLETKKKIGIKNKGRLCGSKNPSYNHNLKDVDRIKVRPSEIKIWRKSVFERDQYTCQISGQKGGKLNAHHLDGWNKHPDKRFNIDNGITISKEYHDMFHLIFGKGNNTKEQFDDFLIYYAYNNATYTKF